MIQRIQTIFLTLSIIAMLVMLFSPLWIKQNPQTKELAQLTPMALIYKQQDNIVTQKNTMFLAVFAFASIAFSVLSILAYKNRMRQVQYNLLNILVLIGILGGCVYFSYQGEGFFKEPERGQFGLGYFMPAVAVLMNSLANRFIRRDEKLVRSVDRLRD